MTGESVMKFEVQGPSIEDFIRTQPRPFTSGRLMASEKSRQTLRDGQS